MRCIDLQDGSVTLVSDLDYAGLCAMGKWHVTYANASKQPYVRTCVDGRTVYMHRVITKAPPTMKADHRDGDGLNNQRPNLRIASHYENNRNRRGFSLCGYKGVSGTGRRYRARLNHLGEEHYLGMFSDALDAARAYDAAAHALYGQFAWLNFPEEWPAPADFDIDPATEIPFP